MSNWNNPSLTDLYADFLDLLKARDVDTATMAETPTNPPTGYIRWNVAGSKFQKWDGAAWVDMVLGGAGGGTGGTTALGTMSIQNANAVAITGGTVNGVSIELGGHMTMSVDAAHDIGTNAKKVKNAYIGTGLVIPVGVDKWVTS